MKAVILAGGYGSRLREETTSKPKPMVEIGGMPIIWHLMKIYSAHGVNDFVICLGYKGYIIKEYFANYFLHHADVTIDMATNQLEYHNANAEPWKVTLVDTGQDSMTGGRIKRIANYLDEEQPFCLTYGDGLGDVDITASIAFHKAQGRKATMTVVAPPGRFGATVLDGNRVSAFQEKPLGDHARINAGFFVCEKSVISEIENDQTIWETDPLHRLTEADQLSAWRHDGFWQPMDTLREKQLLETLYGLLNIPYASEYIADLRDRDAVANAVKAIDPQLVLHMAAQPLVRRGYREPVETMATNVMGTAHLLDALRASENLLGALIVTSDKAYDNDSYDQAHGDVIFREGDALGGRDPYSASKGAQEIVTRSFGQSFFREKNIPVVTARAGNVIGGGDWSEDRLMTDIITAIATNQPVILRSPDATRPWQHVLEPVAGYLMLLQAAVERRVEETTLNFGPDSSNTVAEVVDLMLAHWGSNSGRVTEDKGDGKKVAQGTACRANHDQNHSGASRVLRRLDG